MILGAYQTYADMNVDLPPAPPMFQLADAHVRDPWLRESGLTSITTEDLDIQWPLYGPETLFDFVDKVSVRTRMIYERQTPEIQARLRGAIIEGTTPFFRSEERAIPAPAVLIRAGKR